MLSRAITLYRRGFTIIEILISIVIIALAFTGILAMLAGSTKLAGEVVEDTFAATLARSVYEALREGARKNSFLVNETVAGVTYPISGFLLNHEGVCEQRLSGAPKWIPPALPDPTTSGLAQLPALRASDFAIFIPGGPAPGVTLTGAGGEPIYIFPRPGSGPGDLTGASTENVGLYVPPAKDDFLSAPAYGNQNQPIWLNVNRVYNLSDRAPPSGTVGVVVTGPGGPVPETADQYGFCVAIRRSVAPPLRNPSDGSFISWKTLASPQTPFLPTGTKIVDGLYQVEVRVYRNFSPAVTDRHHEPVAGGGFIGLIALGQADPTVR